MSEQNENEPTTVGETSQFLLDLTKMSPAELVESGRQASIYQLWQQTYWAYNVRRPDAQLQEFIVWCLGNLDENDNTDSIEKIKELAGNLIPAGVREEDVLEETIITFVAQVMKILAKEEVKPPQDQIDAGQACMSQWNESESKREEEQIAQGSFNPYLRVKGYQFVEAIVGRAPNSVDADGKAKKRAGLDPEPESPSEGGGEKKKARVALGKKKEARMLNDTMAMMPQSAGVSMPVYDSHKEAKLLEVLPEDKVKTLLSCFAFAKYLAKPVQEKRIELLDELEALGAKKENVTAVRKAFSAADGAMPMERQMANAMIVQSDMLRRTVAAINSKGSPDEKEWALSEKDLLEMEQASAILTRLGTHKLQMLAEEPVNKFCETFAQNR